MNLLFIDQSLKERLTNDLIRSELEKSLKVFAPSCLFSLRNYMTTINSMNSILCNGNDISMEILST